MRASSNSQPAQSKYFYIIIVTMRKIGNLASSFRFATEIGQQQNNLKRFYKEAHVGTNPNPKHPSHKLAIS